jgi:hypothetical protein
MPKARIVAQIVCFNKATYKYNVSGGDWYKHTWGYWTWKPSWKWVRTPEYKIPKKVKDLMHGITADSSCPDSDYFDTIVQ